ncbi:heat-shock protein Hsp90 [Flavobacterium sp.]|uniref:heat-shock protein Hsp90 n=1 Tax=Flavobacterium sp. TaxID=239 RepID=UPI0040487D9C
MKKIALISLLSLFVSCKEEVKKEESTTEEIQITETEVKEVPEFTKGIEATHKKAEFLANDVISYDLMVNFGGKEYLAGKFTQTVDGTLIRMERADGEVVLYDGKEVYTNKADANLKGDRFDIFTWPYFVTLPYKLNDNGTIWSDFQDLPFYGENVATGKLTFEANIGDAPDDWYYIYKDAQNHLVGAAYIVSFGKGKEAAEKEPHAVKYTTFLETNGIPFATEWTYHMWTLETGFGDEIGKAKVANIVFSKKNEALFEKPENATLVPLK